MDALYHFVLALVGAALLNAGMRKRHPAHLLLLISVLSMVPDLEHFYDGSMLYPLKLHGLWICVPPLASFFVLVWAKKMEKERSLLLFLSVLLFGHLVLDMVRGMYGIPLLYPFQGRLYMLPEEWELGLFGDSMKPLTSTYSIGLAIYFGFIALVVLSSRLLSRVGSSRRTGTRI